MVQTWKAIEVELDLSRPERRYVIVGRDVKANGKEIIWKRKSGTAAFNFVCLHIVKGDKAIKAGRVTNFQQELNCANTALGDKFEYIITVEGTDGVTYTTTEGDDPKAQGRRDMDIVGDGDKPVIRNK